MSLFKRKAIQICLFIIFPMLSLYSQSGWYNLNVNSYSHSLYFVNSETGWSVGLGGGIIKTSDGGANWVTQNPGTSAIFLNCVYFPSSATGYCAGHGPDSNLLSPILKTTNAGLSWLHLNSQTTTELSSVYFINDNTGWIAGDSGILLSTTDGGTSWIKTSFGPQVSFTCVRFTTPSTGYLTADSIVYKTTNSGTNWTAIIVPGTTVLLEFRFTSVNTGYAVGAKPDTNGTYSAIAVKTTNAGASWFPLNLSARGAADYLSFLNDNEGWVTTSEGYIWHTGDGGTTWQLQFYQQGTALCVQFVDARTGYASFFNSIFKTTTGGVIGITPVSSGIPKAFILHQNYPNPFNPVTNIEFELPKSGVVKITLYDILGSVVDVLANEYLSAGSYKYDYNASKLASGIYFYRLEADEFNAVKKMILIK